MILSATTHTLEAVLAGAVSSAQPHVTVCYTELDAAGGTATPAPSPIATNSTMPVTILSAPASGVQRIVDSIHILNRDSASVTITIQLDVSGTDWKMAARTIAAGESACWTRGAGWG